MKLETILKAAVNSMVKGHHAPHCYRAHVLGKGYVNDGCPPFDRNEYLRQLERDATSEVENMGFASDYAEPGYSKPKRGILFANWNTLPRRLDTILEKAGYEVEWSDEWSFCDDCNNAFRTSADSFIWKPAFKEVEGSELCLKCAKEYEDTEETE